MFDASVNVYLRWEQNFLSKFLIPSFGKYRVLLWLNAERNIAPSESAQIDDDKYFLGLMKDIDQWPLYLLEQGLRLESPVPRLFEKPCRKSGLSRGRALSWQDVLISADFHSQADAGE